LGFAGNSALHERLMSRYRGSDKSGSRTIVSIDSAGSRTQTFSVCIMKPGCYLSASFAGSFWQQ
jgi:hypothetical protein